MVRIAATLAIVPLAACGHSIGMDPGECIHDADFFDIHYFGSGVVNGDPEAVIATPTQVIFSGLEPDGDLPGATPALWSISLVDGSSTRLSGMLDGRVTLYGYDPDVGAILYGVALGDLTEQTELRYRIGENERVLGVYSKPRTTAGGWEASVLGFASRPAAMGVATWSADQRIYLFDGESVHDIFMRPAGIGYAVGGPFVGSDGLAFTVLNGSIHEIYLYRDGVAEKVAERSTYGIAIMRDDEVLWLCDEGICGYDDQRRLHVVDNGTCAGLDAGDSGSGRAAWVCDGEGRIYDGQGVSAVVAQPGANVIGIRLGGGQVAWVETSADAPSDEPTDAILWFDGHGEPKAIAGVTLACRYCIHDWPYLELSISSRLLAWTYASRPDVDYVPWPRERAAAYALFGCAMP